MLDVIKLPNGSNVLVLNDGVEYRLGTKARVTDQYVRAKAEAGVTEFVYASSSETAGGYALARSAMIQGIPSALFLSGIRLPPQGWGMSQLVRIEVIPDSLTVVESLADRYVKAKPGRFKVPFGIHDRLYFDLLRNSLLSDPQVQNLHRRRIWLAAGSGTLLSVLLEVLPESIFLVVQVGHSIPIELSKHPRVTVFISPEKFARPANVLPPFQALSNYDAKVWSYLLQYGKEGDAVWIVL